MAQELQKVIRGNQERVYMKFYNSAEVLTNPTSATISVYDNTGTVVVDADSVTLSGVTPTELSTGVWYWTFKPALTQALGYVSFWWEGTIDSERLTMDQPQIVEIIAEPTAGITTAGFSTPAEVRLILRSVTGELDYDDELVNQYIQIADAEVKEDLFHGYEISDLSSAVPRVKQMSQWKTAELLLSVLFATNLTPAVSAWSEYYRQNYERIRDAALGVGVNFKPLLDASGVELSRKDTNQFKSTTSEWHETFTMQDAPDQLIDPDRLDAEDDERD